MTQHDALEGSKRSLLPNSRPAGPVDRSEITTINVRVRSSSDPEELERFVRAEAMKPLRERKYLTREELAKRVAARTQDLDLVERHARDHDLLVVRRSAARRTIVLRGALGDLLNAFPADLQVYHHARGTYRGRRGEILVPRPLTGIVTGIFGYDTRPRRRSSRRALSRVAAAGPGGPNGVAATEFATRYNFPTDFQGTTLDGTGQTVGVIELGGGFRVQDLAAYFDEIGVALPDFTSVSVDQSGNAPTTADSADGEVMLDLEVAGAVVPNAKFVVYFAPNNGDQGFLDAFSAAIHDKERHPDVISVSWGAPENASDEQGRSAFHELFVEAASLGITICVAAGDHGTADEEGQIWDGKIHVDHPAADDLVLACGGTQIEGGEDVAWNDGTPFDPGVAGGGGWATGGGVSVTVPLPSYQANANIPVSLDTKAPGRGVPDIAMSATNYFTRVDGSEGPSGGTSAVAPLMAALVARLNQAKQKNVGFLNPFFYANPALFRDVLKGSNTITDTVEGYSAGPGWDACTGLGTPDGKAILAGL